LIIITGVSEKKKEEEEVPHASKVRCIKAQPFYWLFETARVEAN